MQFLVVAVELDAAVVEHLADCDCIPMDTALPKLITASNPTT
jgi:hypothetical protein